MSSVGSSNTLSETGFVLDSFALLALLGAEKGSGDVAALLRPGPDLLLMTYVNLGEVVYTVIRERGPSRADAALLALEGSRITFVPADRTLTLAAARLKADHRLSYADAFCAALSQLSGFPVVTGDPEFLQLDGLISIRWVG